MNIAFACYLLLPKEVENNLRWRIYVGDEVKVATGSTNEIFVDK